MCAATGLEVILDSDSKPNDGCGTLLVYSSSIQNKLANPTDAEIELAIIMKTRDMGVL